MTPRWRSLLYVPVTSERFVAKAHERGADAVILELEDAVAPSEKDRARALVREAAARIAEAGVDVLVRINRPWRLAVRDIEAAVDPNVRALVLPKVDSAEHVIGLAEVAASVEEERGLPVGHMLLFPRIEGPRGLLRVAEIANAHPRVVAIGLGSSDFTIATGMEAGGDGNVIASFQVVTAAIAAGRVPIGLVGSITEFGDLDAFRRVAERSRALGLRGAPCVHPSQIPILNEVFAPTDDELARARRVVEEYEQALAAGEGAVLVDGEFVDIPFYEQAKRLLAG
ncbi:MAG TPA: CoA ester lyase [Gaiellaceae bacterium]|jgi:citrate lyase subunit beta/citryl-CoA lyase|nr:CoA ester lyase [Gaiellaceae bacterium]